MSHLFGFAGIPPTIAAVGVCAVFGVVFISDIIFKFKHTVEMLRYFASDTVALAPDAQRFHGSDVYFLHTVVRAVEPLEGVAVRCTDVEFVQLIVTAI